jgi:CelD/BcsL family acetyltransferase involved in cellulose biosynthesis
MEVFLLRQVDAVKALQSEWDALAKRDTRDGFFRTPGWYLSWMQFIRPDARPFVIGIRSSEGRLIGLAPLCEYRFADQGFRLKAIGFGGRDVVSGDFLDFLADPSERPEVLRAILDFLGKERGRWDLLVLGEMLRDGDLKTAGESWGRQNGMACRVQEERICPYIALPESFDAFLQGISESMRYHIRRRTRDVLEKHGGRLEVCSAPTQLRAGIDALIHLHLDRWHMEGKSGTLGRSGFKEFLQQICTAPPDGANSRLFLLMHENRVVGALLMIHYGGSALYYQAGWDPQSPLMRFSPGVVLMAHSVQDAIHQGLRHYEFLRGEESYKFRWTKTYRTTVTLLIAQSLVGRVYLKAGRAKDLLKRFLRKDQQRSIAPRGTNQNLADP